MFHELMNNAV